MNVLAGMLFGLAVAALVIPALPQRPKLRALDAAGRIDPGFAADSSRPLKERISGWVLRTFPERLTMSLSNADLDLVGTTRVEHTWKKIMLALLMLVSLLAMSVAAQAMFSLPLVFTLVGTAALSLVAWTFPDTEVQGQAKQARAEFGRAVAVFVELMAAERRRGAGAAVAMKNAASVSDSWTFRRIRQELLRASYNKVQPWTALERLSEQLQVGELGDAARVMALSGEDGASVYEALRALGRGLRVRMLNEEAAREARASDKMSNIVLGVAVMFVMIVLTPMVLTLME